MPKVGDLQISVRAAHDRSIFKEYKLTSTPTRTECYIKSKLGKQFEILLALTPPIDTTPPAGTPPSGSYGLYVKVDGQTVNGCLLGQVGETNYTSFLIQGAIEGPTEVRPFYFGATKFVGTKTCWDRPETNYDRRWTREEDFGWKGEYSGGCASSVTFTTN